MLTQNRLHELLHYEPITGTFRWLKNGKVAGCINTNGYRVIRIDTKLYKASRLAFLYMLGSTPETYVDHIDRTKHNDCWNNLRLATNQMNQFNTGVKKSNKLGVKGVFPSRWKKNPYQAQIKVNGKSIHLGSFSTIEEASAVYQEAVDNFTARYPSNDEEAE